MSVQADYQSFRESEPPSGWLKRISRNIEESQGNPPTMTSDELSDFEARWSIGYTHSIPTLGLSEIRKHLKRVGFSFRTTNNNSFTRVKIPPGWSIDVNDSTGDVKIIGPCGAPRATAKYSVAFADGRSKWSVIPRMRIDCIDNGDTIQGQVIDTYRQVERNAQVVTLMNGDKVLFTGNKFPASGGTTKARKRARKQCAKWLKKHHPGSANPINWEDH